MHVVAPQPADPKLPLFFNIEESVGEQGTNSSPEDIMLVQYLLHSIAEGMPSSSPDGESKRQRMLNVPITGVCDEATIDGIRAWQEGRRDSGYPATIVDGRVSPAHGYLYGGGEWTIVDLNFFFKQFHRETWPRLQDVSTCPGLVAVKAEQVL